MELLKLSPVDPSRLEQAVSGVIILEPPARTRPVALLPISFVLCSNFGGIFFCVKPEAAEEYKELAQKEG